MSFPAVKRPPARAAEPEEADAQPVTVLVRGLAAGTVIGVHAHERRRRQIVVMDLDIELAACRAGASDRLADTVDYAAVAEDLRRCLAQKSYLLLERLAQFVAERILARFGARRVVVQVFKHGVLPDVQGVGVRIERRAAC